MEETSAGATQVPRKRGRRPITDPNHLTPTQTAILTLVGRHEGDVLSKSEISRLVGRDPHTVDMALAELRRRELVVTTPRFDESGAQAANKYRTTERAHELYPQLFGRRAKAAG